jgi:putative flippase GtrA
MSKIKNLLSRHHKFIKHSFVGGFDSLITLAVYFFLVYFGVNHLISNIFAYIVSSITSFYLHLKWVFKLHSKKYMRMFNKYVLVTLFGLAFSEGLLYLCVNILLLNKYISAVIILPLVTIESYLLYKHWAFKGEIE